MALGDTPAACRPHQVRYLRLPAQAPGEAPSLADLARGVKFIEQVNAEGKAVVVSAPMLGRTGALLAAFLVVSQRKLAADAMQCVRDRRPGAIAIGDKAAPLIRPLLTLQWQCSIREAKLLLLAWNRQRRYRDLATATLRFILPVLPGVWDGGITPDRAESDPAEPQTAAAAMKYHNNG